MKKHGKINTINKDIFNCDLCAIVPNVKHLKLHCVLKGNFAQPFGKVCDK